MHLILDILWARHMLHAVVWLAEMMLGTLIGLVKAIVTSEMVGIGLIKIR